MRPTLRNSTVDQPLTEVIARLARHDAVDGVLLIGSTGQERLNPASDYDLVLVLNRSPLPLRVALTYVDHRLTDVIFVGAGEIAGLLRNTEEPGPAVWGTGALLRWLRSGTIAYDRTGDLAAAQTAAHARPPADPLDGEKFSAWFSINYNLRQNLRMAASGDETYLTALDLRLLYCLSDCWGYYFLLRGLPERGEKAQVRAMATNDPEYLSLFRECLAEGNRERRFGLYCRLAERTVALAGGLWPDDATSVLPETGEGWQEDAPECGLRFWAELTGG